MAAAMAANRFGPKARLFRHDLCAKLCRLCTGSARSPKRFQGPGIHIAPRGDN